MLELPETLTLVKQLNSEVTGRTVRDVLPPTRPHKFCWFNGDPAKYAGQLPGTRISGADAFGIFAELSFDNGKRLCVNDGVNVRLVPEHSIPKDYQLLLVLDGGPSLVFTVAMYGGIVVHDGGYDNAYYRSSREGTSPFSPEFADCFDQILAASKPNLSAKALLATEQRFPGVGNGVLQDILLEARIHPKRKLSSLSEKERERLRACMVSVLQEMTDKGGRDTEKDLYGNAGGYLTRMSKNGLAKGCPACGGSVTKETYLGGSIYYCSTCQPLS